MAAWRAALDPFTARQDPIGVQFYASSRIGGVTEILRRAPAPAQQVVNIVSEPCSVNVQVAALDICGAFTCNLSILDDSRCLALRPEGYRRGEMVAAVSKLCGQEQLSEAVEALGDVVQMGVRVSNSLFYSVLKKCVEKKDLVLGRRVHALTVKKGYSSDRFLCNHIMRMYAAHARLQEAMDVFTLVAEPDAFMWSSIISAHVQHGQAKQAIQLYHLMRKSGVKPDGHVFVAVLQACAREADLESGQQVHADVWASRVEPDPFVCSGLVDMYAKCGSLEEAQRVFDTIPRQNVVTWTAMIAGYAQQGMGREALRLYSAMQHQGFAAPNAVTFVSLLQACASVGVTALAKGKELHAQIEEQGLQADVTVGNNLINMYAKCGSLEDAQSVFAGLRQKDVVSWTALIAGYSQQGKGEEALCLYIAMQEEGIAPPNSVTFVCLLRACASAAALHAGRQLHAQIVEQGLQADGFIAISLLYMYGKSGSMVDAQQVFDRLPERDVVAWNALIAGYTRQGDTEVVFYLLHRMREAGSKPDDITFLNVLTVCSHAGLVNKGRDYFEAMSRHYDVTPTTEHYTCMVDLLGRAGLLDEALAVVKTMPAQPHLSLWHTLLGSCRKWTNLEVGLHAFTEAVKLNDQDAAAYVLMSSIYASAQMWEEAQGVQAKRKGIGAWKQPGQSWWTDTDGLVHTFVVGVKFMPRVKICMQG